MGALSRNKTLGLGAIIVVVAGICGIGFYQRGRTEEAAFTITGTPRESHRKSLAGASDSLSTKKIATAPSPLPTEIVVHVAGAVKKPGVYHLKPDMRAEDAIKSAGGALDKANLDAINLAAKLEDGTQLFIPVKGDSNGLNAASAVYATQPNAPGAGRGSSGHSGKLTNPGKEFVNLNTASADELQKLPGVGPAMAARILQHRKENGKFSSPDQLMDVSGIGEKKFAKMKPFLKI